MGFINPFQLVVFPFVFIIALPLALFAGLTTMLAFLVLFLRLFMVYFDVVLEAIRHIVLGRSWGLPSSQVRRGSPLSMLASPSSSTSSLIASVDQPSTPKASSLCGSNHPRRSRRPSTSSNNFGNGGSGAMTPVSTGGVTNLEGLSASTQSLGLERDFEGVGGWRLDSLNKDTDTASEQQWFNLNARLQIPDHGGGNNGNAKHHFRSHSGGPVLAGSGDSLGWYPSRGAAGGTNGGNNGAAPANGNRFVPPSPEGLRMTASPNSSRSRSRTPTASKPQSFAKVNEDGGYFPPYDAKPLRKMCV